MVIDGDGELATGQSGQEAGESEQLVEAAFESGHLLGEIGAEPVPEGLILGVGVESVDGVGERLGAGGRPNENAPEHAGGAGIGITELEGGEAVGDGQGKNVLGRY